MARSTLSITAGLAAGLLAASCTSLNASFDDPGDSEAGSSPTASESSRGTESDDGTAGTDATTRDDGAGSVSGDGPERCGNGELDEDEVCDDGLNDGLYGGCNPGCMSAAGRCGDGDVDPDAEECDDGVNDGTYGGCNPGCGSRPVHCGDGVVQADAGEECDDGNADSHDGCIKNCTIPLSCLEIRDATAADENGVYDILIHGRADAIIPVYCDMVTDGGGYTFFKVQREEMVAAPNAEGQCEAHGMQLWIPRTKAHRMSGWLVATDPAFGPSASTEYLNIMGIYPTFAEAACASQPLHSDNVDCDWEASDGERFWVEDREDIGEPNGDGALDGSMLYDWTSDGDLIGYADFADGGGGRSDRFMCDIGDKY